MTTMNNFQCFYRTGIKFINTRLIMSYIVSQNDIVLVVETVVGDSGEVSAHPACYEHEYRWSSKSCLRADGHQGLLREGVLCGIFGRCILRNVHCVMFRKLHLRVFPHSAKFK